MGISTTSLSLKKLLKKEKFFASIVCSPTNFHIQQGILLAKNNIHILMEKPLCNNLQGSKKLEKILKKNKVFFMIAYIFRFNPMIEKVKNLIKKNLSEKFYMLGVSFLNICQIGIPGKIIEIFIWQKRVWVEDQY